MVMTDPIADMLARLRNGAMANHESVPVPFSKIKNEMVAILKEQGYIEDFHVQAEEGRHKSIIVKLKYMEGEHPVIQGFKRVSRPGRRVYVGSDKVPRVLNGLGLAILSTSQGLLSDKESRERKVGGEVLCYVW
jgi:small subunit ribosomal protein S8